MAFPLGYEDQLTSPSIGGIDAKSAYLQAQQYDKRYADTVAAPAESPISKLARAVDRLSNVAMLASNTSDLLCGSSRVDGKGGPEAPTPEGLFAVMNALSNQMERHIDMIQMSMERIHKIGG